VLLAFLVLVLVYFEARFGTPSPSVVRVQGQQREYEMPVGGHKGVRLLQLHTHTQYGLF